MPPAATPSAGAAEPLRAGAQFRAARERRGLTETQAAAEMRVDLATLRALEGDDYARLGAPIFVKGHLRNYARLLGLEAEPLLEAYERAMHPEAPPLIGFRNEGESVDGTPLSQHWPQVSWLIVALLAAGLGVWLWNNPLLPPLVQIPVREAAPPLPRPAATSVAPEAESTPAALPAPAETQVAASGAEPAAAAPVEPARVQPVAPAREEAAPAPDGALRVQLRFNAESWVEVYDADGNPLVYELYDAGRARSVTAKPPLRVFLGQASAVTLTVDGRRMDLLPLAKRDGTARFTLAAGGELR